MSSSAKHFSRSLPKNTREEIRVELTEYGQAPVRRHPKASGFSFEGSSMTGSTHRHDNGPRGARGVSRHCQACGKEFRPKNSKGRFCTEACKKAQGRRAAKKPLIGTAATIVAYVPFRSKSVNKINEVSDRFRKPRVALETGWQIEHGELFFRPLPDTPSFTSEECRRFNRRHMHLKPLQARAA